jgi:hypothetical protein
MRKDEYDFVNFVEQQYMLFGYAPSREVAAKKFGVSELSIRRLYESNDVRNALKERGIELKGASGEPSDGVFTAEQLAYAREIFNMSNPKSRKMVLKELGLHPNTVQAWHRDPAFQAYIRELSEQLVPDMAPEAMIALQQNIMRGDFQSIKFGLELSGRYSTKTVGELNVDFFLQKILEVLISELSSDPVKLKSITDKIGNLAGGTPAAIEAPAKLRVLEYDPAE